MSDGGTEALGAPANPEQARADDIRYLRAQLGEAFTSWVLDGPGETLTPLQAEVSGTLASLVRQAVARSPELPVDLAISGLINCRPDLGTSVIDLLRSRVAGPPVVADTGDAVLDALAQMAAHSYGELLLERVHSFFPMGQAIGPFGTALLTAVADDPAFPYTAQDSEESSVIVSLPTGFQSGFQWVMLGSSVIQCAWEMARLHKGIPTLDDVVAELPTALGQARDIFARRTIVMKGLASLTGVVVPEGTVVSLPWGRLRAARREDHPLFVADMRDRLTTGTIGGAAEEVTITDAGDVILEANVKAKATVRPSGSKFPNIGLSSRNELERRIIEARLALLLSGDADQAPVVLPVWRRFLNPVAGGASVAWSDPRHFRSRSPTSLSGSDVEAWRDWIVRLSKVEIRRLGVAPARLLRAVAERRDAQDSLIDAVVAWEALLGAETEITFRLSSTIARLLHEAGEERKSTRKRVAEIYHLRSQVIHGADHKAEDVRTASQEAITISIKVIRALVDQPALMKLTSVQRGIEVLMS